MILQVGRQVRPWTAEERPPQCCSSCQKMLEAVENKCMKNFDSRFKALIGRINKSKPAVTPPVTQCFTPCSDDHDINK